MTTNRFCRAEGPSEFKNLTGAWSLNNATRHSSRGCWAGTGPRPPGGLHAELERMEDGGWGTLRYDLRRRPLLVDTAPMSFEGRKSTACGRTFRVQRRFKQEAPVVDPLRQKPKGGTRGVDPAVDQPELLQASPNWNPESININERTDSLVNHVVNINSVLIINDSLLN